MADRVRPIAALGQDARGAYPCAVERPDPVGQPFLTAEWRSLAMLNYEIDPAVIAPFVPKGTELDSWNGRTFVSVVGFLFLETRIRGLRIPFHGRFEEVNLRLYVRRRAEDGWRRAVVFVKELVPRAAIAWVARTLYNENYCAVPMGHTFSEGGGVTYWWKSGSVRGALELVARGEPAMVREGTQEEFITEHYWGYAKQPDGGTLEYRVEHPRWMVRPADRAGLSCDVAKLYGAAFVEALSGPPASAFLAEGSPVSVYAGRRLRRDA